MAANKSRFKVVDGGSPYPTNDDEWESQLIWKTSVSRTGEIVKTLTSGLANVYAILRNAPEWDGVIVYNDARGEVQLVAPPPFVDTEPGAWVPERLSLALRAKIVIWLERVWHIKTATKTVGEAIEAIARSRVINPVRDYLQGVKWDGVRRLDSWLVRYCGAEDTPYTRGVGAAWLRQGVARAFRPGSPFYGMLVLEGWQGKGKSTVFSILGGDYFTDDIVDLHNKDAVAQVRRSWVVELPELSAMRRSDLEATKAFLTRRTDNQRLAYREDPEAMARRCIFGGSTNRDAWLVDTTGNRRFWPVEIPSGATIDLDGLARDRDQLWAEARASWEAGEPANLPPELWGDAAEEQAKRLMDDVWDATVASYLATKKQTTAVDVLVDAIGLKLEQIGHRERLRVGEVLRRQGWLRRQDRSGQARRWVFEPDLPPPEPSPTPPSPTPSPTPSKIGDNPGKTGVVTNVTDPGAPSTKDIFHDDAANSSSYPIGDIGDIGDNRENQGVSSVTNPVTDLPSSPGTGDSPVDAWDARYREHLAAHPGQIGEAVMLTTSDLGPRPDEVPDV